MALEAKESIEKYLDEENYLRYNMRVLGKQYPSLAAIKISRNGFAPLSEFVHAMKNIEDTLDPEAKEALAEFEKTLRSLQSDFFSLMYPDQMVTLNEKHANTNLLEKRALKEKQHSCGHRPDEMLDAAQYQLTARHGIHDDLVTAETVGVYNGSSASILSSALLTVSNKKGDIITPEYHWDGYDAITAMSQRALKEVPRTMSLPICW